VVADPTRATRPLRLIGKEKVLDIPYLGEALSALAPMAWAIAVILFRRAGSKVAPIPLNLFKSTVGLLLLLLTMAVIGEPSWQQTSTRDLVILAISGVIGVALADTVFFYALNILGASRLAVVGAIYMPFVVLLSFVFLGDRFGPLQWFGSALAILAVVLASLPQGETGERPRRFVLGAALGMLALGLMAVGIVMAKPALDRTPVVWASTLRLGAAVVAMIPVLALLPARRTYFAPFRPTRIWSVILPGAVIGTYLAYMLWLGGIKYTDVSVAAILNQLHVIYTVILAAIFLGERLTLPKLAGVALAVAGSVLVVVG